MIYAINMRTKEHRAWDDALAHMDDWIARIADNDGWIEWQGGECPLPEGEPCSIEYRDGDVLPITSAGSTMANDWSHTQHDHDIIAYRPILDADLVESKDAVKQERYLDHHGEDWIDEFARTSSIDEFRGAMRFTLGKYNRRMGRKDEILAEVRKMKDYAQRWEDYEKALLEDGRHG